MNRKLIILYIIGVVGFVVFLAIFSALGINFKWLSAVTGILLLVGSFYYIKKLTGGKK